MGKKAVNYKLDEDLIEALKERAKQDKRTITATLELALIAYLEKKS